MTYEEMLSFLGTRLNYERRGMPEQRELRLDRMHLLLDLLSRPQRAYPIVHVAGSKGKGSTAFFLAAMLETVAPRVGLHTSPHLHRIEERFRINGALAEPEVLAALMGELAPLVARIDTELEPAQPGLTYFEITTALALWHFQRQAVDWAVIEVGMGGRLDSTNVVDPAVSVITSISRDHTRQLGETLPLIAGEKAGIIKPARPVVSGVTQPEARAVIEETCARVGSPLRQRGVDFDFRYQSLGRSGGEVEVRTWRQTWPAVEIAMLGQHQAHNLAVAIAVLDVLADGGAAFDSARIARAARDVRVPGRAQVLPGDPTVVVDVAHNDASIAALIQTLADVFGPRAAARPFAAPRVVIYGTSADKSWREMLAALVDQFDHVVLTQYLSNPRAVPPGELAAALERSPNAGSASITVAATPAEAWQRAQALAIAPAASSYDAPAPAARLPGLVCVTGSFYLVAEFLELVEDERAAGARTSQARTTASA